MKIKHLKHAVVSSALVLAAFGASTTPTIPADYQNMGFGPGVAAIYMFGDTPLDSISIENGIVKTKEKSKARVGPVLEAHYFLGDRTEKAQDALGILSLGNREVIQNDLAFGPTVMLELGENIVRSAGAGLLVSLRKLKVTREGTGVKAEKIGTGFNLGLVGIIEPNVKTLANGLTANGTVPAGTTILDKTSHRFGLALMFSASF